MMDWARPASHLKKAATRAVVLVLVGFLVFGLLGGYSPGPAAADELAEKEKELERLHQRIEDTKRRIEDAKRQEQGITSQLAILEQEVELTQDELVAIEHEVEITADRVRQAREALTEAEAELEYRTDLFQDRAVSIYKYGYVGYLEVLLASNSFADFLNRFYLLQRIISSDSQVFEDVKKTRQEVADHKSNLEEQLARQEELKQQTRVKLASLQSKTRERENLLQKIQNQQTQYEQALDEMEQLSEDLVSIIADLQARQKYAFVKSRSEIQFYWPTDGGWISSYFGRRFHPILKKWRGHTGLDIAVPWGSPIKAAEQGIVIYSGWLGGYGKTVIIDHGHGLSTLYAHNSSLLVAVDDIVKRGQVVSKCGSTGLSTGPHLHFEIRDGGTPTNPLNWLPAR